MTTPATMYDNYHSKVNKTLIIILIKSSSFVQSCSLGIQATETSLTFILNDTISCISWFLLPVIRRQTIRLLQNACYLKSRRVKLPSAYLSLIRINKVFIWRYWFINQWGLEVEWSNLYSVIYISTGSPKVWLVLICIFLFFQIFHSEAEDAFAPVPPQMVQFPYVLVQG